MIFELERLKKEAFKNGHQLARVAPHSFECINGCGAELFMTDATNQDSWAGRKTGNLCRATGPEIA